MSTHRYNPYIAGNPLRREQDFLGREQVLARVASALRIPSVNSLVLFGQRRIGKTSILYHLERTLPRELFAPVYFDLQAFARRSVGELLAELAAVIADRTDLAEPTAEKFDDRGRYFTQTFLPELYHHLPAGVRPVFLLDEFDVLDALSAQDLPRTSAAVAFFPFLSRLMQEDPRPIFVFVFGRHQDDLAIDFTATFKASLTQEIWTLEPSEAEQLVRQAERNDSLTFTVEAVAAILESTNCHPYLTQLLCQRIWERAYRTQPTTAPQITAAHIREVIPDALEAGSQALVWLWDGLSAAEKIYAAALAEITAPGQTISEAEIVNTLTANATRLRTREVEQAPTDLVKRRILTQTAEQTYTFTIPLFHQWVKQRKTLREVKDELDRRDPLAEQYYNIGHQEFANGNWEAALRNYDDALERNSEHFRARLERGEALLELGQVAEGMAELRRAYAQDKREARYALVRGLRGIAEQKAQAGDEAAVLVAYEEILEISPAEQFAREYLWGVWEARGDKAAEANQFEEAIAAYEVMSRYQHTAQDQKKANDKLTAVQTEKSIQARLQKAQVEESQASWQEVGQLYEQLLAEFPTDRRRVTWQAEAERAAEEAELIQQFELALQYLDQREWMAAREVLATLTVQRAGYTYQGQAVSQVALLAQWEKEGDTAYQQENWAESVTIYGQLLKEFPQHARGLRWLEKWQEAQNKQQLLESFRVAKTAIRDKNWEVGRSILQIIKEFPADYTADGWTADYLGQRLEFGQRLQELGQGGQWVEAEKFCQQFNPPNMPLAEREWLDNQILLFRTQGELKEMFVTARISMGQSQWKEAQQVFVEIVKKEPLFIQDGKYAAELLVEVTKKENLSNGTKVPRTTTPTNTMGWFETTLGCLFWIAVAYGAYLGGSKLYDNFIAPEESALSATLATPTATQIPISPPVTGQLGDEWVRPQDGMVMVFVPAPSQPFKLGSGLDAPTEGYWIDKYEVSNAQYELCVADGACEPSARADDADFNGAEYPVVSISWDDAVAYAEWVGAELPTEEQWEYAAGGEDGRAYPWGDEFDGTRLNCYRTDCPNDGYQYTAPVGSYAEGASWVGALDMAGNVREWTSSPYDANSFVVRGGSWNYSRYFALVSIRFRYYPHLRDGFLGVRLVRVPHFSGS